MREANILPKQRYNRHISIFMIKIMVLSNKNH